MSILEVIFEILTSPWFWGVFIIIGGFRFIGGLSTSMQSHAAEKAPPGEVICPGCGKIAYEQIRRLGQQMTCPHCTSQFASSPLKEDLRSAEHVAQTTSVFVIIMIGLGLALYYFSVVAVNEMDRL